MTFIHDFSRLFFPHYCAGCGTDAPDKASSLCMRCLHALPLTNFHVYAGNPVEQVFTGRIPLVCGTAYCHFSRETMMQQVLHALKYRGYKEVGRAMGRMMGSRLRESGRFDDIDALVPVPLYAKKERKRGYNQSALICEGIAAATGWPVLPNVVARLSPTETQTHKNRVERWQNMEGRFALLRPGLIGGRHILLVDDVITSGATIEACARVLLQADGVRLSVAALAWAGG